MKGIFILAVGFGASVALLSKVLLSSTPEGIHPEARRPAAAASERIAANGVVEGASPEVALRPEAAGAIAAVHFRENQKVARGALLVELQNETQKQQVALAEAEVRVAKAELQRLVNGERAERRRALAALEKSYKTLNDHAQSEWQRVKQLASTRSASQEQLDQAYYRLVQSQAELEKVQAERAFVEAPAREDEVEAAKGKIAAAQAKLGLARAELAKTRILAPSDGAVLHVYNEPGEMAGPGTAQPVVVMADVSRLRVRAFVEELDAARVRVGQKAVVTADGLPGRELAAVVAVVTPRMGKRAPQSDAAHEYRDVYYREVLLDLETTEPLPLNLRVQVRIAADEAPATRSGVASR
jgi:multidrug resistance efflux pump